MKAIQFSQLGGPEVMHLAQVPIPKLAPATVLVRNHVAAVNFADGFFLRDEYIVSPKLPDIPGMEAAGVIEQVGPGVTELRPGMRVAYIGLGAYAEYSLVRQGRIMKLPDSMDFEQGAAFPIASLTAYHMLHTVHRIAPGQTVLVHSAAGGVGLAAVQIAKAAGARVIGTVSSSDKAQAAKDFGADEIINYVDNDFVAAVKELTEGRGVELILDGVGKPTFEKGLRCLTNFGHIILYGRAGGAPGPIDPMVLFGRSLTLSGFVVPLIYRVREVMERGLRDVFSLIDQGRLRFPIGGRFPLAEAPEALRQLQSRRTVGKLLLFI